jgi:hypothetical protein
MDDCVNAPVENFVEAEMKPQYEQPKLHEIDIASMTAVGLGVDPDAGIFLES